MSFDIDAGTIEPFDDVKLHANRLIHPEVFFERYRNYKMDLRSKAYIDATAQQVLKIAENVIKNVIKENDGCVRVTTTGYETDVDHVDVCRDTAKVIAAGYDCVEVTSRMYLNVTLDTKLECTTQYYADELGKLLMAIKNDVEDVVNYIETQYHISKLMAYIKKPTVTSLMQ